MNIIDRIKEEFGDFYENGPADNHIQGGKYNGKATHTRASLEAFTKIVRPKRVLEIGAWTYGASNAVAQVMEELGIEGRVDAFDIKNGGYSGSPYKLHRFVQPFFWYPHHTGYDKWKYNDHAGLYYPDFRTKSNPEIFEFNTTILSSVSNGEPYDIIMLDGDHSYEGVKFDWEYALQVSHEDTLVVLDNLWDERFVGIRKFFDELQTDKWDFEPWNDEHVLDDMVQDTGIALTC